MRKEVSRTKNAESRDTSRKEQKSAKSTSGIGYSSYITTQPIQPIQFAKKNETGLPDKLKAGVENLSGYRMDDVKVHYNSDKPAKVNAYAYTQGTDIHVAPGQEKHLPHEAWHVVQQKEGRVKPTLQLKGIQVNDDKGLEHEADVMGAKALWEGDKSSQQSLDTALFVSSSGNAIQMMSNVEQWETVILEDKNSTVGLQATNEQELKKAKDRKLMRLISDDQKKQAIEKRREQLRNKAKQDVVLDQPHLVFETFGGNINDLIAIYEQAKKYSGSTTTILGINLCSKSEYNPKDERYDSVEKVLNDKINKLKDGLNSVEKHTVFIVPFIWTPTEESGGYNMPYVDIRVMLMKKAQELTADIDKIMYRWIDRDVKEDKSVEKSKEFWNGIYNAAQDKVITGVYRWKSNSKDEEYLEFIKEINDVEMELRSKYFELRKTYNQKTDGFYMPEPILYISKKIHTEKLEALKDFEYGSKKQSQETKKVFDGIGSSDSVKYDSRFTVEKPIKDEGEQHLSYLHTIEKVWKMDSMSYDIDEFMKKKVNGITNAQRAHEDILNLKKELVACIRPTFYNALKNLRQSAFDNGFWFFDNNEASKKWENGLSSIKGIERGFKRQAQFELNLFRKQKADYLFERFCIHKANSLEKETKRGKNKTCEILKQIFKADIHRNITLTK